MKKTVLILSLFICAILYSCATQLYMPSSADATQQAHLLQGRKIYVAHCSSCHNLHLPKEYDATGWKKQLDEMQVKAKISEEEKQLVFNYLTFQQ